jgi:hypothetical protein
MAYGPEVRSGDVFYKAVVEHTASGTRITVNVDAVKGDGTVVPEATRNQIFQAFLNKVAELAGTTIITATKTGNFVSNVTVG